MSDARRDAVLRAFGLQVGWCERLGSSFGARLLGVLAEDLREGGVVAQLVGDWASDPVEDAVPLRLVGALHALVLGGNAPALAACFPPGKAPGLREAACEALRREAAFVWDFLRSPPQTNEVGRSAVLLGGFLTIAAAMGPRLRLLEIGASAGLNLNWDRYRYRLGAGNWGPWDSPVVLAPSWTGGLPDLAAPLEIVSRAACDVAPVDLGDTAARLRLRAYVWADQPERLRRLEGAIGVAESCGTQVARADAAAFVSAQLERGGEGCTTVLFHSIMWQYMPAETQGAVTASMRAAGARASEAAPLAWLRFEPVAEGAAPELALTLWPGGRMRRLAVAHPHGHAVSWLDQAV